VILNCKITVTRILYIYVHIRYTTTKLFSHFSYKGRQLLQPEKEPTEQILPFDISKNLLKNHVGQAFYWQLETNKFIKY
jgi:hypothetical protein